MKAFHAGLGLMLTAEIETLLPSSSIISLLKTDQNGKVHEKIFSFP